MKRALATLAGAAVLAALGAVHATAAPALSDCDALTPNPTSEGTLFSGQGVADPATGYTREYCVHVPAGYSTTTGGPLVLVLHGCYTDAPTVAYESHFNQEADLHRFITVYPQEAPFTTNTADTAHPYDGNGSGPQKGSGCWNWFLPDQLQRSSPEPVILTNIVRSVARQYNVDRHRIYVIGISGGGAEANLLAVLYPDLFAAVGVLAGCEYDGASCLGSTSVLPAQASGQAAYQAAGAFARPVPFLVENGDADPVVPVANAFNVVQQWEVYDALAAGRPAPIASQSCSTATSGDLTAPPTSPHAYLTDGYALAGSGRCDLGELIIVNDEIHAWPGGSPQRLYTTEDTYYDIWTDPLAPDLTDLAYKFFMAHPCRLRHGACALEGNA